MKFSCRNDLLKFHNIATDSEEALLKIFELDEITVIHAAASWWQFPLFTQLKEYLHHITLVFPACLYCHVDLNCAIQLSFAGLVDKGFFFFFFFDRPKIKVFSD